MYHCTRTSDCDTSEVAITVYCSLSSECLPVSSTRLVIASLAPDSRGGLYDGVYTHRDKRITVNRTLRRTLWWLKQRLYEKHLCTCLLVCFLVKTNVLLSSKSSLCIYRSIIQGWKKNAMFSMMSIELWREKNVILCRVSKAWVKLTQQIQTKNCCLVQLLEKKIT